MQNKYTESIKTIMIDFKKVKNQKFNIDVCVQLNSVSNDPSMLGYVFDKLLGFKVKYRIFEKVNYIIRFLYKDSVCSLEHHKLSFRLYSPDKYQQEILDIFSKVEKLFEQALLEYADERVKTNKFSLPNHYSLFNDKLDYLKIKINGLQDSINGTELDLEKEIKNIMSLTNMEDSSKRTLISFVRSTIHEGSNYQLEMSYLTELYIDTYFSYLEHILSLLIPMTEFYDSDKSYVDFLRIDWRKKAEHILYNDEGLYLLDHLSKIKEVYRNRISHGLFSREKKIHIQIEGFGQYPLWIGKKHLRGFTGTPNYLTYEIFEEVENVFKSYDEIINERFELQMNLVVAGIPTFLDTSLYGEKTLLVYEDNQEFIKSYWHHQDNQMNMDW